MATLLSSAYASSASSPSHPGLATPPLMSSIASRGCTFTCTIEGGEGMKTSLVSLSGSIRYPRPSW